MKMTRKLSLPQVRSSSISKIEREQVAERRASMQTNIRNGQTFEDLEKLHRIADRNRYIISVVNFFTSLEIPCRRSSFKSVKLSYILSAIRFAMACLFMAKYSILSVFSGCEYNQLRFLLQDWTIFYPTSRRSPLVRYYISLGLVHFSLKRSFLFLRQFDTSLMEHLCKVPSEVMELRGLEGVKANKLSKALEKQLGNTNEEGQFPNMRKRLSACADDRSDGEDGTDAMEAHRAIQSSEKKRRRSKMGSFMSKIQLHMSNYCANLVVDGQSEAHDHSDTFGLLMGRGMNRDAEHWMYVSQKLHKSYRTVWMVVGALLGTSLTGATIRAVFLLKSERLCDIDSPSLRLFAFIELTYLYLECTITVVGMITQVLMIRADLMFQAKGIGQYMMEILQRTEHHHQPELSGVQAESEQLESIQGRRSSVNMEGLQSRRAALVLADRIPESILHGRNIDGHIIRPQPQANYLPNHSWMRRQPINSKRHLVSATDIPPSSLQLAQRRLIDLLCCLERHKPMVSFVGTALYSWLLIFLCFVPLFLVIKADDAERKAALIIITNLMVTATLVCLLFPLMSANITQTIVGLSRFVFKLCARFHGRMDNKNWEKVLYIWYCPNRCAFRVGMLDLTYSNILKIVSYILSGITLTLDFFDRS